MHIVDCIQIYTYRRGQRASVGTIFDSATSPGKKWDDSFLLRVIAGDQAALQADAGRIDEGQGHLDGRGFPMLKQNCNLKRPYGTVVAMPSLLLYLPDLYP